jgi:hypothetical protein
MPTEFALEDNCGGECSVCVKTRRMVSAVVTGVLNQMMDWLYQGELERAERSAVRFLSVVSKAPQSTCELVGVDKMCELTTSLNLGLLAIRRGDANQASGMLRSGLNKWYESYPPYLA